MNLPKVDKSNRLSNIIKGVSSLQEKFNQIKPGDVALIGDPIEHSLSPLMQNAAFQIWGGTFRDKNEPAPQYHKLHVPSKELETAISLVRDRRLRGINVTVPHKVSVCSLLDELDPFAKKIGAVNTIVVRDNRLKGFNTDGDGFRISFERDLDFDPKDKSFLVLGAGGTGRVIVYKLVELGAKVFWWNRTKERLLGILETDAPLKEAVKIADEKEIEKLSPQMDVLVNSTSVGLSPEDGLPVEGLKFQPHQVAFDVIYHRQTRFLQEANAAGARTVDGMGMLVNQGARSFEIWMGAPAPKEIMWHALTQSLKKE